MSCKQGHLIEAQGLGKCYRVYRDPRDRLKQALFGSNKKYFKEHWAARNISFFVTRGETVGLVGRNGSGKSTVLQMLAGTLTPSEGQCAVNGRIGALLELGSGFNPEFTGMENIALSASLCGYSRSEVEAQIDNILSFAEIGDAIEQPIKTYSSGMVVRLAFAVQSQLKPEILIVDEALAVGDELFQKKCYDHITKLKEQGTAILLVSHSSAQILQHCDRALLLHQGRQWLTGSSKEVITAYQRLVHAPVEAWEQYFEGQNRARTVDSDMDHRDEKSRVKRTELDHEAPILPPTRTVYPHEHLEIVDVQARNQDGCGRQSHAQGDGVEICFRYRMHKPISDCWLGFHIATTQGVRLTGRRFHLEELPVVQPGDEFEVSFYIHGCLMEGTYFVGGGAWQGEGEHKGWLHRIVDAIAFRVSATEFDGFGLCNLSSGQPICRTVNT